MYRPNSYPRFEMQNGDDPPPPPPPPPEKGVEAPWSDKAKEEKPQ